MKKKNQIPNALILLLCSFFFLSLPASAHKYFVISGKVIGDSLNVLNCSVEITSKDNKVFILPVSGGTFRFELAYNNEYKLVFTGGDGTTKTILVNTQIPEELMNSEENLPNFLMAVHLNRQYSELASGVQQIAYSPQRNRFTRLDNSSGSHWPEKSNMWRPSGR